MDMIPLFLYTGFLILVLMTLLWIVSLLIKNSSIVDIFWGTGFVVIIWTAYYLTGVNESARKIILAILVTIWGLRLSLHVFIRNHGKPEDFRYQVWRKEAGKSWWWRSFFKVFLLQGFLMWIIAAPLVVVHESTRPVFWLDFLSIFIWMIGFFFEAVGDAQLARFKSDPANKGKVMNTGVWRYSRHPNYFGDATQWWAFFLSAAAAGAWWTIFSPIIMTTLLMRVSAVTLLEKTLREEKPGYKEYSETTSEFIPWFPKKSR